MDEWKRSLENPRRERFERSVREYQAMVFSIALRLLRDRSLAEELAQDVFLQLFKSLDELESEDHVKFWLRRVTCHRAIDEARRRKLRPTIPLEVVPEPAMRARQNDFLMDDLLRSLVAKLPEKTRAIVLMRYQEDLEPSEISRILDVPTGSVKSHLHRTLRLLRGKIERAGMALRQEAM